MKSPEYLIDIDAMEEGPDDNTDQPADAHGDGSDGNDANDIRKLYMEWFLTPNVGEVEFQYKAIS